MATLSIRARGKDSLAEFLGWFSLALGTAQLVAPRAMCRLVGAEGNGTAPLIMRVMGAREIAHGVGILTRPRPTRWVWSRVAGDALDLSALGLVAAKHPDRRDRTALAIANVLAISVPDVLEGLRLRRKSRPPRAAKRIRKAVTISAPTDEVAAAWAQATELRDTIARAGGVVRLDEAPGGRGTELAVELEVAPLVEDIGAGVQKLTGHDLASQLSDDLRRFKQLIETGEVVRSDATPDGHLLAEHLRQRVAQPLDEAVR